MRADGRVYSHGTWLTPKEEAEVEDRIDAEIQDCNF